MRGQESGHRPVALAVQGRPKSSPFHALLGGVDQGGLTCLCFSTFFWQPSFLWPAKCCALSYELCEGLLPSRWQTAQRGCRVAAPVVCTGIFLCFLFPAYLGSVVLIMERASISGQDGDLVAFPVGRQHLLERMGQSPNIPNSKSQVNSRATLRKRERTPTRTRRELNARIKPSAVISQPPVQPYQETRRSAQEITLAHTHMGIWGRSIGVSPSSCSPSASSHLILLLDTARTPTTEP